MYVTKMGNAMPRAGLEPTPLAFQASVLPLHHIGSLKSPLYPRPPMSPMSMQLLASLVTRHPGIVSLLMLTITHIQAMAIHIHT